MSITFLSYQNWLLRILWFKIFHIYTINKFKLIRVKTQIICLITLRKGELRGHYRTSSFPYNETHFNEQSLYQRNRRRELYAKFCLKRAKKIIQKTFNLFRSQRKPLF